MYADGARILLIARHFGVAAKTVKMALRGSAWGGVLSCCPVPAMVPAHLGAGVWVGVRPLVLDGHFRADLECGWAWRSRHENASVGDRRVREDRLGRLPTVLVALLKLVHDVGRRPAGVLRRFAAAGGELIGVGRHPASQAVGFQAHAGIGVSGRRFCVGPRDPSTLVGCLGLGCDLVLPR